MDDKKLSDIYPPKRLKTEIPKEAVFSANIEEDIKSAQQTKSSLSFKNFFISFILIGLVAGVIFGYFNLSVAEIRIWPENQTISLKEKIVADIDFNESEPILWIKKGMVPAKFLEEEKSLSQQFPSSGKFLKEVKAKGQIRVYNNYSTAPQSLVVNTRFISSEGNLFKSLSKITIPGARYDSKGKLQPGYADVEIEAAESGESYNIGPSTFSIPGFVGTPKYTAFYGKSSVPMTGGFLAEVPQVTQSDIDGAKASLTAKLLEDARSSLKNKMDPDYLLLNEALKEEVIEASSLIPGGSQADSFVYQASVKIGAVSFKKSDLIKFAKEFISAQLLAGQKIQEESLKINYNIDEINLDSGAISLDLEFSANVYQGIEEKSLKEALSGKSVREAKITLENQPKISRTEIKFWPFPLSKIPRNEKQIRIKLILPM